MTKAGLLDYWPDPVGPISAGRVEAADFVRD
jgi:hypothetical protein